MPKRGFILWCLKYALCDCVCFWRCVTDKTRDDEMWNRTHIAVRTSRSEFLRILSCLCFPREFDIAMDVSYRRNCEFVPIHDFFLGPYPVVWRVKFRRIRVSLSKLVSSPKKVMNWDEWLKNSFDGKLCIFVWAYAHWSRWTNERNNGTGALCLRFQVLQFRTYFQPINEFDTSEIFPQNTTFHDCIPLFILTKYDLLRLYTTTHYWGKLLAILLS